MFSFGSTVAFLIFLIGIFAFLFNGGLNLIMILISLELIFLGIGLFLVNLSFHFDDMIGHTLTLFLLPLAGAESALGLALLIAYFPKRGSIVIR